MHPPQEKPDLWPRPRYLGRLVTSHGGHVLWGYIPEKPPEKPVPVEASYEGTGDFPEG